MWVYRHTQLILIPYVKRIKFIFCNNLRSDYMGFWGFASDDRLIVLTAFSYVLLQGGAGGELDRCWGCRPPAGACDRPARPAAHRHNHQGHRRCTSWLRSCGAILGGGNHFRDSPSRVFSMRVSHRDVVVGHRRVLLGAVEEVGQSLGKSRMHTGGRFHRPGNLAGCAVPSTTMGTDRSARASRAAASSHRCVGSRSTPRSE